MRRLVSLTTTVAMMAACPLAVGQAPQPPVPAPTTVQLPTFSVFTVRTTVSVPDGGGIQLGGITRASDASAIRGVWPLAGRSIASSRAASGASLHAKITDHKEYDEALLAEAAKKRTAAASHLDRPSFAAPIASPHVESLAAIRQRSAAAAAERAGQAAQYLAQGQQAEADGKPALARIYYQMALRRDTGAVHAAAALRLAALAGDKSPR